MTLAGSRRVIGGGTSGARVRTASICGASAARLPPGLAAGRLCEPASDDISSSPIKTDRAATLATVNLILMAPLLSVAAPSVNGTRSRMACQWGQEV